MRLRPVSFVFTAAVWAMSVASARAQSTPPTCDFDQMQENPHRVIEPCSKLLEDASLPPDSRAQAFFTRGSAFKRTGQVKAAAQDFDVAAKLAPMRSDIYVSRSGAEYMLGQWREGWADLKTALTLDPRNAQAYRVMGMAYQTAGQYDEAIRLYSRALEIDPQEPYALLLRSQRYAAKHDFKSALADAATLVAIPSAVINRLGFVDERGMLTNFHAVALDNRAQILASIGDRDGADKDLDAAVAEERTPHALAARAQDLLLAEKWDDALRYYDEAAKLDQTNGDLQSGRSAALLALHRNADALAASESALALRAHIRSDRNAIGQDLNRKAISLRNLGRIDEATDAIEQAICTSPDVSASYLILLSRSGYWSGLAAPSPSTQAFKSALRACMIDKECM